MTKKHSNDHKSGRRLPESLTSGVTKRPIVPPKASPRASRQADPAHRVNDKPNDPSARTPMPPGFMPRPRGSSGDRAGLFSHELRKKWRRMERSGRITMMAAVGTIISVFFPWISANHAVWFRDSQWRCSHFAMAVFNLLPGDAGAYRKANSTVVYVYRCDGLRYGIFFR